MGLGTLNVWIHDKGDPCKISDETWFVAVTYCSGVPVEWCGTTYAGMEAKCGHIEIEIPPGCYVVFAWQILIVPGAPPPFNIIITFSHFSLVMVECDCKACVHLYNPTPRQSIGRAGDVGRSLVEKGGVPREEAERLAEAVRAVLEHLPKTAQDVALEQLLEGARRKLEPRR